MATLIPFGLRVGQNQMRNLIGLTEPDKGDETLSAVGPSPETKPDQPPSRPQQAVNSTVAPKQTDAVNDATAEILDDWQPLVAPMVDGLGEAIASANSVGEVEAILARQFADMDVSQLTERLAQLAFASRISGEANETL